MHPHSFYTLPNKARLLDEYKNQKVSELPTPSMLIDKKKFTANSVKMLQASKNLGVDLRVHIKTHKAMEGVKIQLTGDGLFKSDKIVVSTLPEAWMVLPLVDEGIVKDMLLGIPVARLFLPKVAQIKKLVPSFKLMVDSESQIEALEEFSTDNDVNWDVFVKVDMGTHRAGLEEDSEDLQNLIKKILSSEAVSLFGFYCHAGHSYNGRNSEDARKVLLAEIKHANLAAKHAKSFKSNLDLTISVGATPTAHSSQLAGSVEEFEDAIGEKLLAKLELHAGNYSCCDLQQVATGLVDLENVSVSVLAEVISTYPGRGEKAPGEQLINAGGIAFSKDTGPMPGYGVVMGPEEHKKWYLARVSQEHGVLAPKEDNATFIPYGTKVEILPQHACMTASNHAWFYVIENGVVVDIWVPAKLW